MIKRASEQKHHHEKQTHAIALKFPGAIAAVAPVKSHARAMEKTVKENFGDPTKLKDILRSTVVAKDPKQLEEIVSSMHQEKNKHRYKYQSTHMGYKGHLFNFKYPNGVIGEIQANLPHRIYGKENEKDAKGILTPKLYSQLKKKLDMEGDAHGRFYEKQRKEEDPKKRLELIKKSREHFREIERRALYKKDK